MQNNHLPKSVNGAARPEDEVAKAAIAAEVMFKQFCHFFCLPEDVRNQYEVETEYQGPGAYIGENGPGSAEISPARMRMRFVPQNRK